MANRKEHVATGAVVGMGASVYLAHDLSSMAFVAEVIGGGLGGVAGGRAPDVLEPPTWPGHRQGFHSIAFAGTAGTAGVRSIQYWQEQCRAVAARCAKARKDCEYTEVQQVGLILCEVLAHVAAGFVPGFVAGYASHLVLDSRTSALPVL